MTGQRVGYIRVSTLDQNIERQLDGVQLDKVFTDKASGKDTARPQLQAALNHLREGDTFVVHSMDRLSRNTEDMLKVVRELKARGVAVQFMKEQMTFDPYSEKAQDELMFTMLSAFAQFERAIIRERQREGIAIAKAKGNVYKGRKRSLEPHEAEDLRRRASKGESKTKLAEEFKISRETLYQYLKQGTSQEESMVG